MRGKQAFPIDPLRTGVLASRNETAAPHLAADHAFGFEKLVCGSHRCPVQSKQASQFTSGWKPFAGRQASRPDQIRIVLRELPVNRDVRFWIEYRLPEHFSTIPYWLVGGDPIGFVGLLLAHYDIDHPRPDFEVMDSVLQLERRADLGLGIVGLEEIPDQEIERAAIDG